MLLRLKVSVRSVQYYPDRQSSLNSQEIGPESIFVIPA